MTAWGALVLLLSCVPATFAQSAPALTTLLTFSVSDGAYPFGGLVHGHSGALYGATFGGGEFGNGNIFQLSQAANGGVWTPATVHDFADPATEGANPYGGLLVGSRGEIYGTTTRGGAQGLGAAFELDPPAQPGGAWTLNLLHSFGATPGDGVYPYGGLAMGQGGTLYGTTAGGGASGMGTVYQLALAAGVRVETVLHSFAGGADLSVPYASLAIDASGRLYGTAPYGGNTGSGGVFALTPQSGGGWTETVLCAFPGGTGSANPFGGVLLGVNGGLYGATTNGGSLGGGAIYRCSETKGGAWGSTAIYNMPESAPSYGTLVTDAGGALYGATPGEHGAAANDGLIFKLTPPTQKGAPWVETTLYEFPGTQGNGPRSGLIWGSGGALYGTTVGLGQDGAGSVFQLTL